MTKWQHLKAVLLLPVMSIVVIPVLLGLLSRFLGFSWVYLYPMNAFSLVGFGLFFISGLSLLIITNYYFDKIGKGTLAPWAPPKHLVVVGIYRFMRNPMITGVLLILFGEALGTGSLFLSIWCVIFFLMNHIYFIKKEEPTLVKRFGDDYMLYKKNVPRWIPRLKPWDGLSPEKNKSGVNS